MVEPIVNSHKNSQVKSPIPNWQVFFSLIHVFPNMPIPQSLNTVDFVSDGVAIMTKDGI